VNREGGRKAGRVTSEEKEHEQSNARTLEKRAVRRDP